MDIGAKPFAERTAAVSGGHFQIQTVPGGAPGNALRVPETVKNGVAECGHTWMGKTGVKTSARCSLAATRVR